MSISINYGEACWRLTHTEQFAVSANVELVNNNPPPLRFDRYRKASAMFPGRPVSPLHYGAAGEQVEAYPTWHAIGEVESYDYAMVASFMSPEAFAVATSPEMFHNLYTILQEKQSQMPPPANRSSTGSSKSSITPNEAIVVQVKKKGAEETILMFLSDKHLANHGVKVGEAAPFTAVQAFVLPGIVSKERAKLEVDQMFPELMYWLTNAKQRPVSIKGLIEANVPKDDVSLELPGILPEPLVPSVAGENIPQRETVTVERARHRHRRPQPVMAMLGRVAASIGKLRPSPMPEQRKSRRAVTLGGLAVAGVAAAYFGLRYTGDSSLHLPFVNDLFLSHSSPHGIAESIKNSSHANVPANQFVHPHPSLHQRPPEDFYIIEYGNYNAVTGKGTLLGDAAIELHKQGIANPSPDKINAAYNKIIAWNKRKLAGIAPNQLSAILRLRIPFDLAG